MNVPFSADWDVSVLARPLVCEADGTGGSGRWAAIAAAALDALDEGDVEGARAAAALLGPAGVVALRGQAGLVEVREAFDGWTLVPSPVPTPDVGDLAAAAVVRASRLAGERRAREDRR